MPNRALLAVAIPLLTGCQARDHLQNTETSCQQTAEVFLPLLYLSGHLLEILAPCAPAMK